MPLAPERRGRAYHQAGHHQQVLDGSGHIYRSGGAVFAMLAYEWKIAGKMREGKAPSRVHRFFHYDDDEEDTADQRMMIENNWCWNWETLSDVPGFDDLDPGLVAEMRSDPRKYLEGNLVTCDEFESVVSDSSVYRTGNVDQMHVEDSDAIVRIGKVIFEISEADPTSVDRIIDVERWATNVSLEDDAPTSVKEYSVKPSGVQPCAADDDACHLKGGEVPLSGGPELQHIAEGETLKFGANDFRILAFEYKNKRGAIKRAFATRPVAGGKLPALPLYTHEELLALSGISEALKRLLRLPRARRVFLCGHPDRELVPGCKVLHIDLKDIVKQIVVASPALLEGLQLHYSPDALFSFEVALKGSGDVQATRRPSESLARHLTRTIIAPDLVSTRLFVQFTIREGISAGARAAGDKINPLKLSMNKLPYGYVLSMPGIHKWKRSSRQRYALPSPPPSPSPLPRPRSLLIAHPPPSVVSLPPVEQVVARPGSDER